MKNRTLLHCRPITPINGLMMPPQTPILLPANSMNISSMGNLAMGMGGGAGGAPTASNAGTLPMMGSAAVLPQYPQQPLPPTPAAASAVPLLSQQGNPLFMRFFCASIYVPKRPLSSIFADSSFLFNFNTGYFMSCGSIR